MNWSKIAAFSGATSVILGAFGAHGLKSRFQSHPADIQEYYLKTWNTAASYHLVHSLSLLVASEVLKGSSKRSMACGLFSSGMVLFSGSLYALVLSEKKKLGAITPIGGLGLIAGWIVLGLAL